MGGHWAKENAQYKENAKKFNSKKKSKKVHFGNDTHSNHVVAEGDASDSEESSLSSVAAFG
eukprot:9976227-Ditylum_brightwellii.AAC.1